MELKRALDLRPDYAEAQANLSTIGEANRDSATALDDPDGQLPREIPLPVTATPEQWCERGSVLQNQSRYDEATEAFTQALAIDPDFAAAYFGLGYGLLGSRGVRGSRQLLRTRTPRRRRERGRLEQPGLDLHRAGALGRGGRPVTRAALQIDPAYANAHYNLGNVYKESGQPSDASACYRRAIYIDPQLVEGHINLGVDFRSSIAWPTRSPATARHRNRSRDAEAHLHRAFTWLRGGRLGAGLGRIRVAVPLRREMARVPFLAWSGRDLGRTRRSSFSANREWATKSCSRRAFPTSLPSAASVSSSAIRGSCRSLPVPSRSPTSSADPWQSKTLRPMAVDIQVCRRQFAAIPAARSGRFPQCLRYLAACHRSGEPAGESVSPSWGDGLKVGIAWRGGGTPFTKRRRSTVLDQWSAVFAIPNVQFVNLQYGDLRRRTGGGQRIARRHDAHLARRESADRSGRFRRANCRTRPGDLSRRAPRSTSPGRWAFRSGRSCILRRTGAGCTDRDDTPWYPSMRLVRQPEFGQWEPVFDSVAESLSLWRPRVRPKRCRVPVLSCSRAAWRPISRTMAAAIPRRSADAQADEERAKYAANLEARRLSPLLAGRRLHPASRTRRRDCESTASGRFSTPAAAAAN